MAPRLYFLLASFIGLAAAVPAAEVVKARCQPHIKCVTKQNECGVRYGGCYDVCDEQARPVAPLCLPKVTSSSSATPSITTVPTSTPVTVCLDYVNSCGQSYGGCFLSTSPYPSFTDPGCPTTTVVPTTTTTSIPTICVDRINSCGRTYGGCFLSTSPFPTFSDPGCPTTTLRTTTTTQATSAPTLCVDYTNSCGRMYGGCFAYTSPFPTFSDPGCPTSTSKPITTSAA